MKKTFIAPMLLGVTSSLYAKTDVQFYGFLKASYMSAKDLSNDYKPFFAKENASSEPSYDDANHAQISVKQSRLGMNIGTGGRASGKLEFDFDGEAGNTHGATSSDKGIFRTRILEVDYQIGDNGLLKAGKKWDSFAGVHPHSYGMTLAQLYQGNTGFLTEAVEYKHKFGNWSASAQLQTLGDVPAYKVSSPIVTTLINYKAEKHLAGFAVKSGEANTKDAQGTQRNVDIFGAKIYYSGEFNGVGAIAEAYSGNNLGAATTGASLGNLTPANIGSNSGPAENGEDLKEWGYFCSVKKYFKKWGVFAGYGHVKITNPKDSLGDGAKATNSATRLGFDYAAEKDLSLFAELTEIETGYYQVAKDKEEIEKGRLIDIGLLYRF